MNKVLATAAVAETATGFLLLMSPPMAVRVPLGAEISGAGIVMSRIAAIALIGLGVSCWPGNSAFQPLNGMLVYSTLVMTYLIYIGVRGEMAGLLLWPAVVAHALDVLLVWSRFKERTRAA